VLQNIPRKIFDLGHIPHLPVYDIIPHMEKSNTISAWLKPTRLRLLVQWGFLAFCLFLGVQFGLFVQHYESFGATPSYIRPPGVEGFLPIGALVSLKYWLTSGRIDPIHPAALVLFLTFLALALLTRKSFCSWICPVGTLEESFWKLGKRLFGRNFKVWHWLDIPLRGVKYLLLAFFLKLILLDMPAAALQGFLAAPYWAVADVKMLHFFTSLSALSLGVIGLLALLSLFFKNAWCRYLCPYGALLGLFSYLSPLRITRDQHQCIDCGKCSTVCPALLEVHRKRQVLSPECTGCLTCVSHCPAPGALDMKVVWWRQPLPGWVFGLVVLAIFAGGVGSGMLSGHWETSLTHQDFQRLIPLAQRLGH